MRSDSSAGRESAGDENVGLEALSSRRRRAWLAAVAPDEPHKLARRLAWDGLDAAVLERRWSAEEAGGGPDGEPWAPAADDGDATDWWPALQACRQVLQSEWQRPLLPYDPKDGRPFVDLWWPIRGLGIGHLRQGLGALPGEWIEAEPVIAQLADSLLQRLCEVGDQVLWQKFSAGRGPGVMLLAHLGTGGDGSGPPVRDHYEAFIRGHRRDGLASLLGEFPLLGRWIGIVVSLWQEASAELLRRVWTDREELEARFGLPSGHRLCGVTQGLSDPHRGGRAVAVLRFGGRDHTHDPGTPIDSAAETGAGPAAESSNPDAMRIVYKPKDMGVDAAYQAALADLNAHSSLPPLRTLTVSVHQGYGYMEFVPHRLCGDAAELDRFYANAGRLLAVLHLLGCTDCHHENLMACGDQLLLIDTETLLEPELPDHVSEAGAAVTGLGSRPSPTQLQLRLRASVLRSGLLPQWLIVGAAKRAVDISGLGVQPPREAERLLPGWLGINSDGMLLGRLSCPVELPTSLPVGIGAAHPFAAHLETFCAGFERQCQALANLRQRWLAPAGALEAFRGLRRRIVVRDTRIYGTLQRQLLAAEALRSPFARSMVLEQLARTFLLAETRPRHWPVFAAEVRQMQRLDIPFFTHRIDGDALELDDLEPADAPPGSPRHAQAARELPGFISTSGLQGAQTRLEGLNGEEAAFQLRLIRGAVLAQGLGKRPAGTGAEPTDRAEATEGGGDNGSTGEPPVASPLPGASLPPLEAASRVAQELLRLAIADPAGEIEWLGMDLADDGESFRFGPVGPALYGGAIGVACLLRRLQALGMEADGLAAGDGHAPDFDSVIRGILKPLQELVSQPQGDGRLRWWRDQSLGLSGCGGLLLALQLLGENALVDSLLKAAPPNVPRHDQQLDLIGGSSGLIGPLLRHGGNHAIKLARVAANHLLDQQTEQGAWSSKNGKHPLLGFSHGTAGQAAALARMHLISGEDRYLQAAAAALTYERDRFDPHHGNWPDYRHITSADPGEQPSRFVAGWCSGAPGIALARACLWGTALWDDHCQQEMEAALRTTTAHPGFAADHLCCGNLGLMAILERVGTGPWPLAQGVRDLCRESAGKIRQSALARCEMDPNGRVALRCMTKEEGGMMLPDFFRGLSGMGLALLEDPESQTTLVTLLSGGLWPAS